MEKRIVVPVEEPRDLGSHIAPHFGRTPYFALVELDEKGEVSRLEFFPNAGGHFEGGGSTHDRVLELHPGALVVQGMGPRGLEHFKGAGIPVFQANVDILGEVVTAYVEGHLEELTTSCPAARHCHRE